MELEVRRVASLADRAAVVRLRVDIATRARNVYGGTDVSVPEAAVTGGTYGAFLGNLAVAAVDTWFTNERPLPSEVAERVGVRPGGAALAVLERVHVHPDHRDKKAIEALLHAMLAEAGRRRLGRVVAVSDFASLPAFRAQGFHPEGPVRGRADEDDLYVTVADVDLGEDEPSEVTAVPDLEEKEAVGLPHSVLAQLERILPPSAYLKMIPGARVPRSGRTGALVVLVAQGTIEVSTGGRAVLAVRANEALGEPEVDPHKVWSAGPHGALALALSPEQLQELIAQHPELGARVAGAVVRGLVAGRA
jgi:hypothetical protein